MVPISARSRRPLRVPTSMLSSSLRASAASSTGVLPLLTTCLGPRTGAAGLCGSTPCRTRWSNSARMAARCCLTVGGAARVRLDVGGHVHRRDLVELEAAVLGPAQEAPGGAGVRLRGCCGCGCAPRRTRRRRAARPRRRGLPAPADSRRRGRARSGGQGGARCQSSRISMRQPPRHPPSQASSVPSRHQGAPLAAPSEITTFAQRRAAQRQ